MKAPVEGGGTYALPPAGLHRSICTRIIDLGTTDQTYQGETKRRHQVFYLWELSDEMMEANDEGEVLPFCIGKFYTLSMHEKANLRKDLEAWRAKGFTDEEAAEFDIEKVLGAACYLNVTHGKKANGEDKAVIAGVNPLPKSVESPAAIGDLMFFDLSSPDMAILEGLSNKMQEMVKGSFEWQEREGGGAESVGATTAPVNATSGAPEYTDDDIPF